MLPGIVQRQQEIIAKKERLLQAKAKINALINYGQKNARNLWSYYEPYLLDSQKRLVDYLASQPLEIWAGWNEPVWSVWNPGSCDLENLNLIRIGEGVEPCPEIEKSPEVIGKIPILLPFVGSEQTFIIHSQNGDTNGLKLLQSLVFRTAVLFPLQARYTFIDPAGAGRAFPMKKALNSMREGCVRENTGDLSQDLTTVNLDIQRIIENYFDMEISSFESLPKDIRAKEKFEFIFAANFPFGYERQDIECLYRIANSGAPAGKYLFIHFNEDYPLPEDLRKGIIQATHLGSEMPVPLPKLAHLKISYDTVPPTSLQTELFNKLSQAKSQDT
jgi:hypothetical protein